MKHFKILNQNGNNRVGEIKVNGKSLETPCFFPVIAFYCGGNWTSFFGGGIYRGIKEFLMNKKYSNFFNGILTSISHLVDFTNTKEKINNLYLKKSICEHFNHKGILFVDSGGYKIMTNGGIKGKDFEIPDNQEIILNYQKKFGADIIATLDYPISINEKPYFKRKKTELSIKNAMYVLERKPKKKLTYLPVHGHSKKTLNNYFAKIMKKIDGEGISNRKKFDGIAIGSLVPLKNNYNIIVDTIKLCKIIANEYGLNKLPVHVFGISCSMLPILTYLGVDTFDSATYLYAAINGKYYAEGLKGIHINKVDFRKIRCECEICKNHKYRENMKGKNIKFTKDQAAPLAMHNLYMYHRELDKMKEFIKEHDEEKIKDYMLKRFAHSKQLTKIIRNLTN